MSNKVNVVLNAIGLVKNTVYIKPFYAGDFIHELTISRFDREEFLREGIKEYPHEFYLYLEYEGRYTTCKCPDSIEDVPTIYKKRTIQHQKFWEEAEQKNKNL